MKEIIDQRNQRSVNFDAVTEYFVAYVGTRNTRAQFDRRFVSSTDRGFNRLESFSVEYIKKKEGEGNGGKRKGVESS